ncbi:hypothetical protein EAV90_25275 [Bradyrhizobium vignae]|nr:hypothetical protein EAV90_25275 [Bradyrhizobium vignae]
MFEHDLFGKPLHTFPDHALVPAVVARLARATQYSRDSVGIRRSCGVLDSPLSRGMTPVRGAFSPSS